MKAFLYVKKSSPLLLQDVPTPQPKDDQVLVEIHTVGINAADYRSMQLGIVPRSKIYGADIAGRVAAVGSACQNLKVGDRVAADISNCGSGGMAEFVAVPENTLSIIPEGVSDETAAATPMPSITALQGIRNFAKVKAGQKVMVHGASGGVGTFAVQLCRYYGAEVTGVCSTRNVDMVRELGAQQVIDYTQTDIRKLDAGGYDSVLIVHGSHSPAVYQRLLKPGGISVLIGGGYGQLAQYALLGWMHRSRGRRTHFLAGIPCKDDLDFVLDLVKQGQIKPVIEKVYPFAEVPTAMKYASSWHASGKVVIRVK